MPARLFEFEDQDWFPQVLRDYQMAFLATVERLVGVQQEASRVLATLDPVRIVDLASGAGRTTVAATEDLREWGAQLLLTDKFPNTRGVKIYRGEAGVTYAIAPLDVLRDALPESPVYTMFNAFHHFGEEQQLEIIRKVKRTGASLHVFEPLQPNIATFVKVLLATLLGPILLAPFFRPFSWTQLLFTYVLPVGIFVTFWDGVVSVMRAPGRRHLDKLAQACQAEGIMLTHSVLKSPFARTTYIRIA